MIGWPCKRKSLGVSLLGCSLALAVLLSATWGLQSETAFAQMAPVGIGLEADAESVTVGDVLTLTLKVSHPSDHHVIFPDVPREWGEFEVRKTTHLPTEIGEDESLLSAMTIEAVLFQPGVHSTPELSVAIRRPNGSVINRPVRPIEIEVASVLASGANELKDIRPQAEVPFPATWPWMFGGFTSAAALILLGVYFWRRMLSEAAVQTQQVLTPLEHALATLDSIERQDLPRQGRYLEHYALVAECLRTYLFGQFRIPAPELTTEQSISVLDRRPVPPNDVRSLGDVLGEADLVKFARLSPELSDARAAVATARRVVNGLTDAPSRFRPSTGYTSGRYTR